MSFYHGFLFGFYAFCIQFLWKRVYSNCCLSRKKHATSPLSSNWVMHGEELMSTGNQWKSISIIIKAWPYWLLLFVQPLWTQVTEVTGYHWHQLLWPQSINLTHTSKNVLKLHSWIHNNEPPEHSVLLSTRGGTCYWKTTANRGI